jgi:preprotein translocase subunit YajC
MPQPMSFFVPVPFAAAVPGVQEPKAAPDTPAGPGPGDSGTQVPGGPGPGGPQQPPPPCADSTTLWIMGGGLLLMWFLVMRPEQKRRKEQQAMLASIKAGDTVVTLGGMHGVVASVADKTVTLRVDAVKMTFDRTAIARVVRDEAPAPDAKKG